MMQDKTTKDDLPIFTNGSRKFIVNEERYSDPQYFHDMAHLIDIDTKTKFAIPFKAIDGLPQFFLDYYSEMVL